MFCDFCIRCNKFCNTIELELILPAVYIVTFGNISKLLTCHNFNISHCIQYIFVSYHDDRTFKIIFSSSVLLFKYSFFINLWKNMDIVTFSYQEIRVTINRQTKKNPSVESMLQLIQEKRNLYMNYTKKYLVKSLKKLSRSFKSI
jgi:hypothetical protein